MTAVGDEVESRKLTCYLGALVDDVVVLVVSLPLLENPKRRDRLMRASRRQLGREVVLVAPSRRAKAFYHGRADLADMVRRVPLDRVRWSRFTLEDEP